LCSSPRRPFREFSFGLSIRYAFATVLRCPFFRTSFRQVGDISLSRLRLIGLQALKLSLSCLPYECGRLIGPSFPPLKLDLGLFLPAVVAAPSRELLSFHQFPVFYLMSSLAPRRFFLRFDCLECLLLEISCARSFSFLSFDPLP